LEGDDGLIFNAKKAVFFGAHTDDEMVAAGTLHRLTRDGCEVAVVSFSPAATADDRRGTERSANILYDEWLSSIELIGATGIFCPLSIWKPSATLAKYGDELANYVYDYCEREMPDVMFCLSPEDENPAHAVVGVACERVARGRVPTLVRCQFPWNYHLGRSNLYVALTEPELKVKQAVIDAYKSQHFRYRYGEMLMNYARADGLSVKVEAAEKFELVRGVI